MNQNSLVSIIMPCYNAETTVERCLESILDQSYKNIELVVVNDGSTDHSEQIIQNYQPVFEKNQMILKYVFQENQGLGGAINTGLKHITGEYLCWVDPDDFLFPESVEKRLKVMEEHPEVGVVSSDANVYYSSDLQTPVRKESRNKHMEEKRQFENMLLGKAIFCAGCHMIRVRYLDEAIPGRDIYPARRGQNWQLLLPMYYHYEQIFLDEPLYAYIEYQNSMSRTDVKKSDYVKRYNEYKDIVFNTLDRIRMSEKENAYYKKKYLGKYYRELFYTGISFHDFKMIGQNALKMMVNGEWHKEDSQWIGSLLKKRIRIKRQ
ncbi:MAG: glycosyltransferase family 2 protein [Solobacterium sp.]|nr:glycosyltransferase family 2 protein [Solobacterium sp.]